MMAAAAASTDDVGFDFNFQSDGGFFDDIVDGGGDDDDIGIDIDSFFTILNEDLPTQQQNLPDLPINPFYQSMDYPQEGLSAVHLENNDVLHLQQGYGAASESSTGIVEVSDQVYYASPPDVFLTESNGALFGKNKTKPGFQRSHDVMKTECFPSTQNSFSIYDNSAGYSNQNSIDGVEHGMLLTNEAFKDVLKNDLDGSKYSRSWFDNKTTLEAQVGAANISSSETPLYEFFDSIPHDSYNVDKMDTLNTFDSSSTTTDEASAEPFCWGLMDQSYVKQDVEMKDEKNRRLVLLDGFEGTSCRTSKEAVGEHSFGFDGRKFVTSSEAHYSGGIVGHPDDFRHGSATKKKPTNLPLSNGSASRARFSDVCFKKKVEAVVHSATVKHDRFYGSNGACAASLSDDMTYSDADDDDVCILEDLSSPAQMHPFSVPKKSLTLASHMPTFSPVCSPLATPFNQVGISATRVKAPDERLIFQAVVQDLSQPMSEATPPDGVMEVPLLRHQRIALSWMVQKETTSVQCSGGILADDQGLGKTISTIALLLTERAPLAKKTNGADQCKLETLNLDEEDDKIVSNGVSTNGVQPSSVKGRPSGGTLVVCPTSVLRQWGDELKNKVADKAKLSVCMYHGSNRTKDPYELANYDVVLTTYSIVSMEVPKPTSLKDEKDQMPDDDTGFFSKKRKHSSKSDKRRLKKEMEALLESSARPLARVNWFRVVLDEAQSIKNYRTQVAQACWGLRAKRRWCLSGTPIQNAVDDLYSYFRFLRYDPYSVYKSFCTMVKFPITKNPSNGYKKLQAVLKTIMLRRTKGTLLDGEPIINLPPKTVKLKKVEFSEEERDFYCKLESDSRAQFQAYADSGTVKQNYVNILLMLLRLRQACDHPFLVKGYGSNSALKSSIQAAKKLPRERHISLLNCLEASLAICGICSDPPEDAVVSICGHVFCNQCISERLTGDDNQCPVRKCKTQLNVSSVFSKGALKSCLSVEYCTEGSEIGSASEFPDQAEGMDLASCFNSSKIKAALRVLRSLSKPQMTIHDSVSKESSDAGCLDKSSSTSCSLVNENQIVTNGPASSMSGVKEKAIVFSQWTSMLGLLEDGLKICSIQYRRLDGTMSVASRDKAVKDFNTLPEVTVMIMSLKAASLGLNMVAACHVLLLDLWWNPTTEDQAIDRAHRIGQTRPVTVVRLTVKDTVEDRILALQQKKRELVASAFGEDETGSQQARLTVEDLKYLFMA